MTKGCDGMQRNIKFRAWHKADKKMYEVYGFSQNKWFLRGKNFPMPLGAIELMQFTELKDVNVVEIYEGDILIDRHNEEIGKVVFEDGSYFWETETFTQFLGEINDEVEVVGNIWEDDELLEGLTK